MHYSCHRRRRCRCCCCYVCNGQCNFISASSTKIECKYFHKYVKKWLFHKRQLQVFILMNTHASHFIVHIRRHRNTFLNHENKIFSVFFCELRCCRCDCYGTMKIIHTLRLTHSHTQRSATFLALVCYCR